MQVVQVIQGVPAIQIMQVYLYYNTTKAKAPANQFWSFFYTQTEKKRAHQVISAQNLRFHSRQQRDPQIVRGLPLVDIR